MTPTRNMDPGRILRALWLVAVVAVLAIGVLSGGSARTLEMETEDFFKQQYSHNVPYPKIVLPVSEDEHVNQQWAIHNVNTFQWIILGLMLLVFLPVRFSFGGVTNKVTRVFRGFCLWIRDEMVYPVLGEDEGRKFAPYFIFLFFFIMFMNVVGMIPSVPGVFTTYTSTGSPYVTGALAAVTFATMLFFGMRSQGVASFFRSLVPHGLPLWLLPIMVVVELIALFVKPFALMIRLFANMLAGHLVIASLIGLVFLFAKMLEGSPLSYGTALPALGMAVFVFIIEAFITLLQAYIFVYLSILFLQQAMHPAH